MSFEELKARLPLPELLQRLGLFDYLPAVGTHRCPLHREDRGASFSIFQRDHRWVWKCHGACGIGGDELSLIETVLSCSRKDAAERYRFLASNASSIPGASPLKGTAGARVRADCQPAIAFPNDLAPGSRQDLQAVANLRKVDFWAVATMQKLGYCRSEQCLDNDVGLCRISHDCALRHVVSTAPVLCKDEKPTRCAVPTSRGRLDWNCPAT